MTSAAEQLAANFNFGVFKKAEELKKRLLFTLGALIVYRIGTYIPLPGVNPSALADIFKQAQAGILGFFNMFSGGAVSRLAIFALNVMPYISASIIIQLLTSALPSFETLKKEGEQGRLILNQYTRYLTVFLALIQAYGISVGLESSSAIVLQPGWGFRITSVITLTGGAIFLMWLGEQITSRGIGNGPSLLIFTGIVAELPASIAGTLELGRQGALSTLIIALVIFMSVAVIAFIVFMERAQRRLVINYPMRQAGSKLYEGRSSFLPLKLNTAGVIPPIFASSLLLLPITIVNFSYGGPDSTHSGIMSALSTYFAHGQPVYMIAYVALIVFFAFFYTAIVFNPQETADQLRKQGGFIPGIRPGERTVSYIDTILTRITFIGALYIALICLLPELLISALSLPFYFGGTSLLIVVTVTMDIMAQIQGYLLSHQYEGLLKKSNRMKRKKLK
jgi:preprotein translocase subunit SecY